MMMINDDNVLPHLTAFRKWHVVTNIVVNRVIVDGPAESPRGFSIVRTLGTIVREYVSYVFFQNPKT